MINQEIIDNAPNGANKYILYNDGTYLYLKVFDFFQYWNQGKWIVTGNTYYINFDLNMIGIFPIE